MQNLGVHVSLALMIPVIWSKSFPVKIISTCTGRRNSLKKSPKTFGNYEYSAYLCKEE